ncbi:MAG: anti-sigma factor family protein, partial [Carbonactinosporaceae bacterium]
MSHLGDRIAALVDGELSHDARDRVLTHIAQCVDCRSRADVERRTKGRLADLRGPDPGPGLSVRLLAIAEPGPPIPPERRPLPGARRPPRPTV